MFPLVHYFVNREIYISPPHLLVLGGFWPDLAFGAGINRDQAHAMGREFHSWCRLNNPEALDLARGILSHGSTPPGVDYYADEFWPGYRKGWCFMRGEAYMQRVAAATGLKPDYIWWKAHNFVELSFELITYNANPAISGELMAALMDKASVKQAARLLAAYHGLKQADVVRVYENAPRTFAIENVTPYELARKQHDSFLSRHGHSGGDIDAMAKLLADMSSDLLPEYAPFMETVIRMTGDMLREIDNC